MPTAIQTVMSLNDDGRVIQYFVTDSLAPLQNCIRAATVLRHYTVTELRQ